jgi:hypothetical protein
MMPPHQTPTLLRAVAAGFAGGLAWIVALTLFFGPAQAILANPNYQSQKFLSVVAQLEPLPRAAEAPWILPAGLLVMGVLYGVVYHFVRRAFPRKPWWKKGLQFGLITWVVMVPWFEFYLPWNVMHEPAVLVILEMALWLAVLLTVGIAIAGAYEWRLADEPPSSR